MKMQGDRVEMSLCNRLCHCVHSNPLSEKVKKLSHTHILYAEYTYTPWTWTAVLCLWIKPTHPPSNHLSSKLPPKNFYCRPQSVHYAPFILLPETAISDRPNPLFITSPFALFKGNVRTKKNDKQTAKRKKEKKKRETDECDGIQKKKCPDPLSKSTNTTV